MGRWFGANTRLSIAIALNVIAARSVSATDELEGKLVTEIRIHGIKYTKEYVVTREIASRVGEPFKRENVDLDKERLDRTRIFSSIDVKALSEDDGVVIDITVTETFPYLPIISMQVNDENGVSLGPGFRSINFLGRGIELGGSVQFGGAQNAEAYIRNPWIAGNHVSYEVNYFRRDRTNQLDNFEELANELDGRFGSWIGQTGRIGAMAGASSFGSDEDGITIDPDNTDTIPYLGFYLGYDNRDLWTNPSFGWWTELDTSWNDVVNTDADYWTTNVDVRRYHTFARKHTTALFTLATFQSGVVGTDVPIHQDFHLGGTNTVRGWSLNSRIGKNQNINMAEYRYHLLEPLAVGFKGFNVYVGLQVAGFVDYGLAWDESQEFATNNFITGYGVGLRLLVPFVDQVRLDFAWGEPGQGMTFHFGIFPKAEMQRARVR